MPASLTENWLKEQLAICEAATEGPWMLGWPEQQWPMARRCITSISTGKVIILGGTDRHGYEPTGLQRQEEDGAFIIAAHEGYPATLEALQAAQGELRTVYAILQGLHFAIDAMSHENIKECLGQLLVAGAEWLEKGKQDADTEA